MGNEGTDLLTLYEDRFELGQLDISEVRNDQMNVSGFGQIASLIVVLDDDIAKKEVPFTMSINPTALLIDAVEQDYPLNLQTSTADISTTRVDPLQELGIEVFPNPSQDFVQIRSSQHQLKSISILDISGRSLMKQSMQGNSLSTRMDLSTYSPGLYLLQIETSHGMGTTKLYILR